MLNALDGFLEKCRGVVGMAWVFGGRWISSRRCFSGWDAGMLGGERSDVFGVGRRGWSGGGGVGCVGCGVLEIFFRGEGRMWKGGILGSGRVFAVYRCAVYVWRNVFFFFFSRERCWDRME